MDLFHKYVTLHTFKKQTLLFSLYQTVLLIVVKMLAFVTSCSPSVLSTYLCFCLFVCFCLVFLVFVFCFLLWMFSYDNKAELKKLNRFIRGSSFKILDSRFQIWDSISKMTYQIKHLNTCGQVAPNCSK